MKRVRMRFHGAAVVLAGFTLMFVVAVDQVVPAECLADQAVWTVMLLATLPLLVAMLFSTLALSAAHRWIRSRILWWVVAFGWVFLILVLTAAAVEVGRRFVFDASMASGVSSEAFVQCVSPRMSTDYLNATNGLLFWIAVLVAVVVGVVAVRAGRDTARR
ncbi:hypothetical protein [Arenimonas alkanexedens]